MPHSNHEYIRTNIEAFVTSILTEGNERTHTHSHKNTEKGATSRTFC